MLEREEIFNGHIQDEKYKLKNLTDALMMIYYEQKHGMQLPDNSDLREGFLNPYIATYNSLKLRLLKDKTMTQKEFEQKLYGYLHADEEVLKEAICLAASKMTNYEEDSVYVGEVEMEV